jgi:hypothetical protein
VFSGGWETGVIAIITGLAGIVSAAGGMLLIVRAVRNKERKAAKQELDEVSDELHEERETRIQLEELAHQQRVLLAQSGIALPAGEMPKVRHDRYDESVSRSLSPLRGRLRRRRAAAGDSGGDDEPGDSG